MDRIKDLTRAEEEVMMALWKRGPSFVKDLLEEYEEPRPAYNTVSTITRILQKKGFVGHDSFGKSHQYFALVTKDEYREYALQKLIANYFDGAPMKVVEYFVESEMIPELAPKKGRTRKKDNGEEEQLDLFL
jgi:predicted transcriptional regulator